MFQTSLSLHRFEFLGENNPVFPVLLVGFQAVPALFLLRQEVVFRFRHFPVLWNFPAPQVRFQIVEVLLLCCQEAVFRFHYPLVQ